MRLTGFLNKLEYAACAFYTRCMIRSRQLDDPKILKYFENLVYDEFRHLSYLDKINNISEPRDYKDFLRWQQKIVDDNTIGNNRNWVTSLKGIKNNSDLSGIGSRFFVFQKTIGQHRFTKDLDWDSLIAFIHVVDTSNHLFYRLLSLFNDKYKPLYIHTKNDSEYKLSRWLVVKWSFRYVFNIIIYSPIDLIRIILNRKNLFLNSHQKGY